MNPFVLVHGSNDGSWVWKRLSPLLRRAGHEVYAPTLSGLADRAHLVDCGIGLNTHIRDVANLIVYEDLSDVVLVGSSYGGMVITGVASEVPERLKTVVYLDAYVPHPGQSEADLWPQERRAVAEEADSEGEGLAQPPPLELFGVTDSELMNWIKPRLTPHPAQTYTDPAPPTNPASRDIKRVFIHCTGNPPTTPDVFGPFARKARSEGWIVHEIAAGHLAMLTAPDLVAELLIHVAARPGSFE